MNAALNHAATSTSATNAPMSSYEQAILVAVIAACATLGTAIIAAIAAYFSTKRDRRRQLYGEALKAALGWREMLYRVRRRSQDEERNLINQFHTLQEQLVYYEGWIASESRYMGRSYKKLVRDVKSVTEPEIQKGWQDVYRPAPGDAKAGDVHPDVSTHSDRFMRDVRAHLSPWQVRKLWVVGRNWKDS